MVLELEKPALDENELLTFYDNRCANFSRCNGESSVKIYPILPIRLGGSSNISNYVPLCDDCRTTFDSLHYQRVAERLPEIIDDLQSRPNERTTEELKIYWENKLITLQLYDYKCAACDNCGDETNIEIHHIVFREDNGQDSIGNLIPLCTECHHQLHAKVEEMKRVNKKLQHLAEQGKHHHEQIAALENTQVIYSASWVGAGR